MGAASALGSGSAHGGRETFLQCLLDHSHPSHPISTAIYTPNNASYSSVLQSYIRNLRFNMSTTPKPLLILTALHESHFQAAIVCARMHGLQMKIRSGGHDYETETACVQAGATLGEVYHRIAEKSKVHGFPAGVCPKFGVGGHFSGGGYGNMMRKYGLSVDNIIDAQLVVEELAFVVLAYKIKIVRVPELVTVFLVRRTLEQNATGIVCRWHKLDEDLFIRLVLDVVNGSQSDGKTIRATFRAPFLGDSARLLSVMKSSFPELGLVQYDCIEMTWLESVLYWTEFPIGTPTKALLSRTPQVPALTLNPYGGKMGQVPATATPFPHRAGNLWKTQYATNWNQDGKEQANHHIELTRKLYNYMTPFVSKNPRKAFLNYRDLDLGINHNGKESY
ncbi:hypothetical protein GH714_016800 [Hevea brasiliensis]|uniref:FAD linked oxidase N-terminal domain-containing protein n=1 Tax=Hevea brasiliensis TaxID=3981 RepID=A0A6A6MES2_HEVBR|nr:hypothetical protein GH714_016800 [Hevea brasiliensis]